MMTIAERAARYAGQHTEVPYVRTVEARQPSESKRPWRRPARTRNALAARRRPIEEAIRFLAEARIPFSQSIRGKLVVPPLWKAARVVTFWPARERLRVGKRPTRREQDLNAFREALADQGHFVPGIPFRFPGQAKKIARAERRRSRLEMKLLRLEYAQAAAMERFRRTCDRLCRLD